MKLRNKKTGDVWEFDMISMEISRTTLEKLGASTFGNGSYYAHSIAELNDEWEDYKIEPLIKDEKIRKAVRAWAEAGGLEHFTVVNEHFNCCKIMGRKYNRVSKIEFLTTIPDATHRTYTIAELCGEEEE